MTRPQQELKPSAEDRNVTQGNVTSGEHPDGHMKHAGSPVTVPFPGLAPPNTYHHLNWLQGVFWVLSDTLSELNAIVAKIPMLLKN